MNWTNWGVPAASDNGVFRTGTGCSGTPSYKEQEWRLVPAGRINTSGGGRLTELEGITCNGERRQRSAMADAVLDKADYWLTSWGWN